MTFRSWCLVPLPMGDRTKSSPRSTVPRSPRHEKDLCFGPAVIAAYDLEKDVAFYPRIVVSPEARAEITRAETSGIGPLAPYLREDFDGERFLHFLSPEAIELCGNFRAEKMGDIRRELNRVLSSSQDRPRIRPKLVWLARYFNSVLEEAPISGINPLPLVRRTKAGD